MDKLGKACMVGTIFMMAGAAISCRAQSSVLLFGTLDEGIDFTSNAAGGHAYPVTSIDLVASQWGLRGTEALGGGWQAVFDVESGFNIESGAASYGGRLFVYQSYVGMQND